MIPCMIPCELTQKWMINHRTTRCHNRKTPLHPGPQSAAIAIVVNREFAAPMPIALFRQDSSAEGGWTPCEASFSASEPSLELRDSNSALTVPLHPALRLSLPTPSASGPPAVCLGIEQYIYAEKEVASTLSETRNVFENIHWRQLANVEDSDSSSSSDSSDDSSDDDTADPAEPAAPLQRDIGQVPVLGFEGTKHRGLLDVMVQRPGSEQLDDGTVTYRYTYETVDYTCHCPMVEVAQTLDVKTLYGLIDQTSSASAFILLVDAADKENLLATKALLETIEPTLEPPAPPMLILAGNMDHPDACNMNDLIGIMNLNKLFRASRRPWYVQACSSTWEEYLCGISWVFQNVSPPPPKPKKPKQPKRCWHLAEGRCCLMNLGFADHRSFESFVSGFNATVGAALELPSGAVPRGDWDSFNRIWVMLNIHQRIDATLTGDGGCYLADQCTQTGIVSGTIVGPGTPTKCEYQLRIAPDLHSTSLPVLRQALKSTTLPLFHPPALKSRQDLPIGPDESPDPTAKGLTVKDVPWGAPCVDLAHFSIESEIKPEQLPISVQSWGCAAAACIRVCKHHFMDVAPDEFDGAPMLTVQMPDSWQALEVTYGDLHRGLAGCILWDLSILMRLESDIEVILIVGHPSGEALDNSASEAAIELELKYSSMLPREQMPGRLQFCRVFSKDSSARASKFVKQTCRCDVTLRQRALLEDTDGSRTQVIQAATEAGATWLADCLIDGDCVGCHLPLLTLLAMHSILRPDDVLVGLLSISLWHIVLDLCRPVAASKVGSVAEELEFAANQLNQRGQVKWSFDNQFMTPFQLCGLSTIGHSNVHLISEVHNWSDHLCNVSTFGHSNLLGETYNFWAKCLGDGAAKHAETGELVVVDVLINAAIVSVRFCEGQISAQMAIGGADSLSSTTLIKELGADQWHTIEPAEQARSALKLHAAILARFTHGARGFTTDAFV